MTRSLSTLAITGAAALALMAAPAAAPAQDSGWWAPVAERLSARDGAVHPVCRDIPDLPACQTTEERERDTRRETRTRDGDRRARGDIRWEEDRNGRDSGGRRGNGPPFCRNGEGHPVHGTEWCRDKGWSEDGAWQDVSWEDVILGRRGSGDRQREARLERGGLLDVLGDVVLGRLERQGSRLGDGALTGRMIEGRTRVLQVRAGGTPLAELLDADRDGRVDRVLLFRPR